MIDAYWLANRQKARDATVDLVVGLRPYAIWTIQQRHLAFTGTPEIVLQKMKAEVRRMALLADERFHRTRNITRNIDKRSRFEGMCFPEKVRMSPHVHIALFLHPGSVDDRERRTLFALEHLPTAVADLDDADTARLRRSDRSVVEPDSRHLVKVVAPQAYSHVVAVRNRQGIADYVTKEFSHDNPLAAESAFFLSEFYSTKQRVRA